MYRPYATPLSIELRPSRQAGWWLALTHAAGLAVLPFAALPAWAMALLGVATLASLRGCWPRHVSRRHPDAVRVLAWQQGDDCVVTRQDGRVQSCRLAPGMFMLPWLVILTVRPGRRRHSLFILPDMLPGDAFRRLRVRLRTQAGRAGLQAGH